MEQYLSVCHRLAKYSGGSSVGIIIRVGEHAHPDDPHKCLTIQ